MPRRARSPQPSLTVRDLGPILRDLRKADQETARVWPGEDTARQPVHTVYGGAHLFRADTAQKLGAVALATLDEYAPDADAFAAALGLNAHAAASLRTRVVDKLRT